jgi:hypothetical protein
MRVRTIIGLMLCASLAACGGGSGDPGDVDAGDDDGGDDDDDDEQLTGCKKIDLLISVDASVSMEEELAAMSMIFGDFAESLLAVNTDFENFRTGVVDSCPTPATFNTQNSADASCGFASGESWIDSASPSMVTEFECVGDMQASASCDHDTDEHEQPIKAAIAALGDGVNPGFVRDDALLVVMAVTDEDEEMVLDAEKDEAWTGTELDDHAATLYDGLIAAKGGEVKRMVFIGIGGGMPSGCPMTPGTYGTADPAEVFDATADRFIAEDRGVKWDLCQGNLAQALDQALAVIASACDDFPSVE